MSRRQLFTMFAAVYFVQGVIQAHQMNFFKLHLDSEGIDANRLAIVASLGLVPFVIKWVFGLISDRYPLFGRGHRTPYMLIGLVSTAIAFGAAFFVDPSQSFGVLAAMVLAATFFMALFDTTADALAVDVVPPDDHSVVQTWMNGGRAAGLVVSLGLGFLADTAGYRFIFLAIAALLLVPLWFVNRVRVPATRQAEHTFDRRAFRALLQPRYATFCLVLILAWTSFQGIDGLVTYYMSNQLDALGQTIGAYGTIEGLGILVGGMGLAFLVRRTSRHFGPSALGWRCSSRCSATPSVRRSCAAERHTTWSLVIPARISLSLDGRMLPGLAVSTFADEVKSLDGDDGEVRIVTDGAPPAAEPDMGLFETRVLRRPTRDTALRLHAADAAGLLRLPANRPCRRRAHPGHRPRVWIERPDRSRPPVRRLNCIGPIGVRTSRS